MFHEENTMGGESVVDQESLGTVDGRTWVNA